MNSESGKIFRFANSRKSWEVSLRHFCPMWSLAADILPKRYLRIWREHWEPQ